MKAFTDLKQSKKLAKILPLESADMYYDVDSYGVRTTPEVLMTSIVRKKDIPCWSLAALLSVLPRIDIEKEIWSSDKYDYRVKAYIGDGYVGDWYDNLVDACYEIIINLHELEML